ncbi:MAG: aspartyl protease family protein [Chloroflexi bacterium]|nr:aspartyl protease family protein [Chloroflexota bacterium]
MGDPQGQRFEPVEALVDTGATNTMLPASLLAQLGVQPYRKFRFELADASRLELEVGRTWVRVNGQEEFTQVVFGREGSSPILGAVTLQEMGFTVDPVREQLVSVDKYLM